MGHGFIRLALFAAVIGLAAALPGRTWAQTVIAPDASAGSVPSFAGTGLFGLYSINDQNPDFTGDTDPLASFLTTNICFPDCHASSFGDDNGGLAAFTSGNATNITFFDTSVAPPTHWEGSLLSINGYLAIDTPGTYSFFLRHDDNESLSVGGQEIANLSCCGVNGPYQVSFAQAGLYAIALTFAEGGGGSYFDLTAEDQSGACFLGCYNADNQLEPNDLFYSDQQLEGAPAPVPGSGMVSIVVALGALVMTRRRRLI